MTQAVTAFYADDQPPSLPAARLAASGQYCRRVARERSASFYQGMRLVAEPKRSATFALYAWMRALDDLADEPGDPVVKRAQLERFWSRTRRIASSADGGCRPGEYDDAPGDVDFWPAFADAVRRHRLPLELMRQALCAQLMDLDGRGYRTFAGLYRYCYRAGAVVGLLCIEVWGYRSPEARCLAELRGVAFQLTNILRDVREDALRGRVYLPTELLAGRPVTPEQVLDGARPTVIDAVRRVAVRAEELYRRSESLDPLVDPSGRACLRAMTGVYRELLGVIARNPDAVLDERPPALPKWRKLWIAGRALCGCR